MMLKWIWPLLVDQCTNNYYAITGLTLNTAYEVRVAANCNGENSPWSYAHATTSICISGNDITIGTDNISYTGVPVNSGWGNTMCQSIYTADELTAMGLTAGTISQLKYTWTVNSSYAKVFTIYMGNTNDSIYANSSSEYFVPFANQTLVYSGSHPINTVGTVTYTLGTPFVWDGKELMVYPTLSNYRDGFAVAEINAAEPLAYVEQTVTTDQNTYQADWLNAEVVDSRNVMIYQYYPGGHLTLWKLTKRGGLLRGDVDDNGVVNVTDVTTLINFMLSGNVPINYANADCDSSKSINITDVTMLINYVMSGSWGN